MIFFWSILKTREINIFASLPL